MKSFSSTNTAGTPIGSVIAIMVTTQVANSGFVRRILLAKSLGKLACTVNELLLHQRVYVKQPKRITSCQSANAFIRNLASEWKGCQNVSVDDTIINNNGTRKIVMEPRFKRKAVSFFNKGRLKSKRLDDTLSHSQVSAQNTYCSLCSWTFNYKSKTIRRGARQGQ